MSGYRFLQTGAQALMLSLILTVIFAAGLLTGSWFFSTSGQPVEAAADEQGHEGHDHAASEAGHDDHGEEHIVSLSKQAYDNLNLKMGLANSSAYWKTVLVPGQIVEIPGRSNLTVSAPVTGVIEKIHVLPGESLSPNDKLFVVRITDESLIDAQSRLLNLLTEQQVNQMEIDRLAPLIQSGAVTGTQKRELEYKQQQLKTQQQNVRQELEGPGLPIESIEKLIQSQNLVTSLTISSPDYITTDNAEGTMSSGYSIENIQIHPGQTVLRGNALCDIAYHTRLYIEGSAFESDLPVLNQIIDNNWSISAENENSLEHDHDNGHQQQLSLKLLRIDNHIDETTQTVRFFIELKNKVTHQREEGSKTFELWKYRPGQRLHLRLPMEQWSNQLVLSKDAVAVDGPNVYVFRQHVHQHAPGEDHGRDEPYLELEAVPVKLLHRDDQSVVIALGEDVSIGDVIATNNGTKLFLAMQMQAGGGGGGHHHDH